MPPVDRAPLPVPTGFTMPSADGRGCLRCWRWSLQRTGAQTLLVLHGLGDHGRALPYARLAAAMAAAGHGVVSFDQQGHGEIAPQQRGRARLSALVADALVVARGLAAEGTAPAPPVLIGLSMGALVALRAAQAEPALARAVVSAAAPLGPVAASALTIAAARALGALWPRLGMDSGVQPSLITDDAESLASYTADPLFHTRVSAGLGNDLLDAPALIRAEAARLTPPLLMLHSRQDRIATWDDRLAVMRVRHRCTVRLYEQGRHNLFLDRGRAQVFADLQGWLAGLPRQE